MQTGNYIKIDEVLMNAAGFSGNTKFMFVSRGFMLQQVEDAFRQLNMDSKMLDGHADFKISDYSETLNIPLPSDCFNLENVWIYSGDICDIGASKKVYWKNNFFSRGSGYLANVTDNNVNDPYILNSAILGRTSHNERGLLFCNVQNGVLMLSESCRNAGTKVHIAYNSTGCEVGEAPIIPIFFKQSIEDFVTEATLRFRMVNEPSNYRMLRDIQSEYKNRTDRHGFNGSWHDAVKKAASMSTNERNDLAKYLGKGAWATGR